MKRSAELQLCAFSDFVFAWSWSSALLGQQLPQNVRQNAALLIVVDFDGRLDTALHGHVVHLASGANHTQGELLLRLEVGAQADDLVGFAAVQGENLGRGPFLELHR